MRTCRVRSSFADAFIVDPGIVAGEGQAGDAAVANGIEQTFGNAAQAEAPGRNHHVVAQHAVERGSRIGKDLVHRGLFKRLKATQFSGAVHRL